MESDRYDCSSSSSISAAAESQAQIMNFDDCSDPSHNHIPPHHLPSTYTASDWKRDKLRVEYFLGTADLEKDYILRLGPHTTSHPETTDWIIPTDPRLPSNPPNTFTYLGKVQAILRPDFCQTRGVEGMQMTLLMLAVGHGPPVIDIRYEICRPVDTEEMVEELRKYGLAFGRQLITDEASGRSYRSLTQEGEHLEVCYAVPVKIAATPEGIHALAYHMLTKIRQYDGTVIKMAIRLSRNFSESEGSSHDSGGREERTRRD
ncbi:hypothetical protein QBC40DRAFT_310604 [Triangularia verruculosa]|uniref:Uncharacterized protein n=1 Tax=Triangularia verruculosa TaxID=2587418 RepID=A0AAN6X8B8_9PEZI|nr:hypothetical protein QBC40DRAFT_310604 [Triangularia verruculosa]